ncbi:tetratricopeptide repeat protein [Salisaeta longa]|uniref:tetratricopeptide repeat protein n=1 Tax=Salisaeta longa TaxID=503170 RepID=UPI0012FB7E54|nr:tetratricopeptide repeat protein [Salisaeta longa]
MRVLLLSVLLWSVTASPPAHAQRAAPHSVLQDSLVRHNGRAGLNYLYNMQFEKARPLFAAIEARFPNHPIAPFLQGLSLWWKILPNLGDRSHDDRFYHLMDTVIARCEALLREHPNSFDAQFLKGTALAFKARLQSNRGDWLAATLNGKRAIGYIRTAAEQAPGTPDFAFGKGMYDYYAAIIPKEYPVSKALMWMLPDGDRSRGLRLLQRAARNGWYVQTEATYFLTQIYYLYEEDFSKSRHYAEWLLREHPRNPYFQVLAGRIYARWGRWTEARRVFASVVKRHGHHWTGYTDYLTATARFYLARDRLYANAYDEALVHLAYLEALTASGAVQPDLRVLGYLYQGMVYDAQGRRALAKGRYRHVLGMQDAHGAHERARRYLNDPYAG